MRWLDYSFIGTLALAVACSDDGILPANDDGVDTTPTATGQGTGADEDSGGAGASTGEAATGTGDDTGPADTATGGTETEGSTGEPPMVCEAPEDCTIVSDCCRCEVFPVGAPVPECRENCRQPMCDALGVPPELGTSCQDGECGWEPRNCSPGLIVCDGVPPECAEGLLPEVTPEGDCWTGACVPEQACEGVPSCELCEADEACVNTQTQLGPLFECVPVPEACMGTPTCECMPPDTCMAPFDTCSDGEGVIECSCPAC